MDEGPIIAGSQSGWTIRPPGADSAVIASLASGAPIALPTEYLDLLRLHDGGEGKLGSEPGWFCLWPASEVLISNREYQLPDYLPGFFGFGSNGGGELLALDYRGEPPWPVVMVPFIPLDAAEAQPVAKDFAGFVRLLGVAYPGDSSNPPEVKSEG